MTYLLPAFVGMPEVNRVYCIDALALLRAMPDNSVDAIIADPPYNLTQLKFECVIDWAAFWKEARRVLAHARCPVILFSQQPFTTDLIMSNRAGWRYELVWEKMMPVGFLDANRRPLRCHENIEIFADKGPDYFPEMEYTNTTRAATKQGYKANHYNQHIKQSWSDNGTRFPRSVWKFAQRDSAFGNTETLHPTEKPLPLLIRLVRTFTAPDALILDPFAGSGTTAVAARNLGRRFIAGDTDAEYCEIARRRLAQPYTPNMFDTLLVKEAL